ncbi:uncharacterized protein TRIREDRAFT_110258 [Trichoderma reesei QM6a]|uniref:Predicted protein n=2 Tax=Hypocrea jecorina TaxID=51453 RepID=G0RRM0_HYPJQ|nr:uncharacterized protein TRIREDRAFT_110258 [Trichoderma reesei QM6a]EGR46269.1 predicted protein [Trichoderma reesei QM6a]ETR99339.1 hypothetical protein M419DRAFT_37792 [Trichoderma reesei RUT C-30]
MEENNNNINKKKPDAGDALVARRLCQRAVHLNLNGGSAGWRATDEWLAPSLLRGRTVCINSSFMLARHSLPGVSPAPASPSAAIQSPVCSAAGTVRQSTGVEKLKFKAAKASTRASPSQA